MDLKSLVTTKWRPSGWAADENLMQCRHKQYKLHLLHFLHVKRCQVFIECLYRQVEAHCQASIRDLAWLSFWFFQGNNWSESASGFQVVDCEQDRGLRDIGTEIHSETVSCQARRNEDVVSLQGWNSPDRASHVYTVGHSAPSSANPKSARNSEESYARLEI